MDKFETGVFEISTQIHDFLKDWQEELAKKELERRARAAMQELQRPGVPYVTCVYPAFKRDGKLVLLGWIALALWEDCEVGECVFLDDDLTDFDYIARECGVKFEYDASTWRHGDKEVYIYRRMR